jgi:hypothetical protein
MAQILRVVDESAAGEIAAAIELLEQLEARAEVAITRPAAKNGHLQQLAAADLELAGRRVS